MKIKKGDKVVVIAGHEKGKEGVVIASMPSKNMVVVEGLNKVTKHNKPNQQNKQVNHFLLYFYSIWNEYKQATVTQNNLITRLQIT